MPQYIALLGAINVGGHNVKMADLRARFEGLGFTNVATFIASGNVIFDTPTDDVAALEALIEPHLKTALGYNVPTLLRTPAALAQVAAHWPFLPAARNQEGASLYINFLKQPLGNENEQKLLALNSDTDTFAVQGCEMYWFCRTKISESPLASGTQIKKAMGTATIGTMRNLTTVQKLAAKYAPQPE